MAVLIHKFYCSKIVKSVNTILLNALLIFFLISKISSAQPEDFRFENITSDDGLSQNSILCIFQDSRQFLWFGTYDGLNRYDGYSFKIYKTDKADPKSISGQVFSSIVEDNKGNLWIASVGGGLNKYNRFEDNFSSYRYIKGDSTSLPNDRVRTIFIDSKNRLWVGTDEGLCRLDNRNNKFVNYNKIVKTNLHPLSQLVHTVCQDAGGYLWIGTWAGLIRLNPETNEFKYYYSSTISINSLMSNFIGKLYLDKSKNLWIGTSEGLNKYDAGKDSFIRYENGYIKNSMDKNISDIIEDNSGNLWLTTNLNGLFLFNPSGSSFKQYVHNNNDKESISSNILFSLYQDHTGILWIGTEGSGVNKLNRRKSQFVHYGSMGFNNDGPSNDKIFSVIEDKDGIIWLGTYGGGLNRFDQKSANEKFKIFSYGPQKLNSLIDDRIRTLCEDNNGKIWIGTENGISVFDKTKKTFKNYLSSYQTRLSSRSVFSICQIRSGEILVGTFGGGLNIYDKSTDKFRSFRHHPGNDKSLSSNLIWTIFQDKNGNIWIGTQQGGLNKFNIDSKEFVSYLHDPNNPNSISDNTVLSILESKKGVLWIGTTQGLNKLTVESNGNYKFICYSIDEGLPDNNIQSMLEDDKGFLWIGTNKGLSKFDPKKLIFKNFDVGDGLQSKEFFVNACLKLNTTNQFIFGGNNGFNIFYPDSIKQDLIPPKVILTNFLLFNSPVPINTKIDGEVILDKPISEIKEIVLSYKQNIISFEFAALHFATPSKNSYAYLLEGFDKGWNYIGNRNYANYTSIPPGEYVFRVKAANPNGIWNENGIALKVIIVPPFYTTIWFRIFISLLIILSVYFGYKLKMRNIRKREHELEKLISEKTKLNEQLIIENKERKQAEKQLLVAKEKAESSEKLKSEFLAQMSHEIRSPINTIFNFTDLIKGSINLEDNEELKSSFNSIENASDRIVRTIDLILNMSEIQTGSYECIYKEIDVNVALQRIFPEFAYKAKQKNLEFILNVSRDSCMIIADEYSLIQICVNIIDNAIKYTFNGKVEINSYLNENGKVTIKITDTGVGISEEYLTNIFTAFFQEQQGYTRQYEGNGLGLALVKKYCEMNNAEIFVESKKNHGSTFTIVFNKTL